MKWNEMTVARKILTVAEHVSGILYWIFFLLQMLDILDAFAAILGLMVVHSACRILTENNRAFKIMWGIMLVFACLLSVWALWMYLK